MTSRKRLCNNYSTASFGKKKMEVCMTVFEMIEAQQKGLEDTTVYMVGQQLK